MIVYLTLPALHLKRLFYQCEHRRGGRPGGYGGGAGSPGGGTGGNSNNGGRGPNPGGDGGGILPPTNTVYQIIKWLTDRNISSNSISYKLLIHYINGKGSIYYLSYAEFNSVKNVAEKLLGSDYMNGAISTIIGKVKYYKKVVNFFGITTLDMGMAFGDATVFFNTYGEVVGIKDYYDFNARKGRGWMADLSTNFGSKIKGTNFDIRHGIYD